MPKNKIRLDMYLFNNGFSASIEKAKREILSGWVKVNGETIRTSSRLIRGDENVTVDRPGGIFVSRGGEKLYSALKYFEITLTGKNAVDLGSSTGGFTDCILKAGAKSVYSIDVGYGQFDYTLRMDKRVVLMERTNVRNLKHKDFRSKIDFIAADLSFISLTKVYDKITELFPGAECVFLIKPQFECGNNQQKKGVVRTGEAHREIINRVINNLQLKGMEFQGLTFSPIKGPAGNIEFLLHCRIKKPGSSEISEEDGLNSYVSDVVEKAHEELN